MQRDVPVVVELADRDPQPVTVAHRDDRVAGEGTDLTGSQPGAQHQVDQEPVQRIWVRAGGTKQRGGLGVVQELRERVIDDRQVDAEDRGAGRGVGPVPLDDPVEERPDAAQALPDGVGRRAGVALLAGTADQVLLVVLDLGPADLRERAHVRVLISQERAEPAQGLVSDPDARSTEAYRDLLEVAAAGGGQLRALGLQREPSAVQFRRGDLGGVAGADRAGWGGHRATADARSSSRSAPASMASLARWYSLASQSLARCR